MLRSKAAMSCYGECFFDQMREGEVVDDLIEIQVGALQENLRHQPFILFAGLLSLTGKIDRAIRTLVKLDGYRLKAGEIVCLDEQCDRSHKTLALLPTRRGVAGNDIVQRSKVGN